LKAEDGFATVAPVRVAAREQRALGDKDAIFIARDFDLRDGNDHVRDNMRWRMQRKGCD
jgi:hypothetical protein